MFARINNGNTCYKLIVKCNVLIDRLFQEARKIVSSLVQHITYNEWLPVVLGKPVIDIFELKLKPSGFQRDYNATINPTLANAVATAAFRFGHSLVRNSLTRCTKDFKELPFFVKLHKEFNDPSNIHNLGSVDRLLLGLLSKSMAKRDEFIAAELTNHLFQVSYNFYLLVNPSFTGYHLRLGFFYS